jgi:hypothetical protein
MYPHPLQQLFFDSPVAFQVIGLLSLAFTIWMMADAYRRGADYFWYYVIFFLQPVGAVVYFFAVKARDFRALQGIPLLRTGPSLADLRHRAATVPTLANHLAYAERLIDKEEYAEALPHLEAAHKREPEHWQVVYLLALCHVRQGRPDDALPLLEKLTTREPRWSHCVAWKLLLEAREGRGDLPGALAAGRELARFAPTLENSCAVAERFLDAGQPGEAREVLERALADHDFAPFGVRWRDRKWARQARQLLAEADRPAVG